MLTMKPKKRGRPASDIKRHLMGFRLAPDVIKAIAVFQKEIGYELPQRLIVELLIRYCENERAAGRLKPGDLFKPSGKTG